MMNPPSLDAVSTDFWGQIDDKHRLRNGDVTENLDITPYMDYYQRQWHIMAADIDGTSITVNSHEDIVGIIQGVLENDSRESIISHLKNKYPKLADSYYENSVNLAARLLVMLKIGVVKHQVLPRRVISWEQGSLADLLREQFTKPQILDTQHVRLPKSFNAWALNVIGGLRIEFTDNLADHLLLVDDDTKVLIFHHASFLEYQRKSLFPDGFVDETLRTLALFFPQSEFSLRRRSRSTKRTWLQKLCSDATPFCVDTRIALCGNLRAEDRQIERFAFWRDRIIILRQVYDDTTPRTLSQWWHDRRNGERWYTFWIAILVLIITTTLGVIQCVESGLQVYKAYYPTSN
ncbi:hypothetical protein F5Y04DRAFT_250313 [Hypomontagnella monticulosa]|nr:hypothetical protein F5Y04DRAFT_250313 [Hypomontagnella monticulosa]